MDDVKYYGLYSTIVGTTNVSILTEAQEEPRFPPVIFYNENRYRFIRYYRASSPSQVNNLYEWAKKSNIETNINLNS